MADTNNETSELVDDDVLPEEYPPERPYGVNERLTATEEQSGESLEERARRERPDRLSSDQDRVGRLFATGDEDGVDDEGDEIAFEMPIDLTEREGTDREEVMSAEEAAMHLTGPPPMHDSDGYVDN